MTDARLAALCRRYLSDKAAAGALGVADPLYEVHRDAEWRCEMEIVAELAGRRQGFKLDDGRQFVVDRQGELRIVTLKPEKAGSWRRVPFVPTARVHMAMSSRRKRGRS